MPTKRAVLVGLAVVVAFAAIGVVAGVGWWQWWKPVRAGTVYQHHPYFLPDVEFRSTGTYVAIAAPLGLVLGLVGQWLLRRVPLLALLVLVVGAIAGGAAMLLTGWLLGPESALAVARHAKDGAAVHASMRVQPGVAWCAMPIATVIGCLGVLLSTDHRAVGENVPT